MPKSGRGPEDSEGLGERMVFIVRVRSLRGEAWLEERGATLLKAVRSLINMREKKGSGIDLCAGLGEKSAGYRVV